MEKESIPIKRTNEFFNWIVILSVALFAINNWWLKYEFSNWLTGKLSDLLFCFFFPLYCSAILSFLTGWKIYTRIWIGVLITLISFSVMKTSTYISEWVTGLLSAISQAALGLNSVNIVDPTDLFVTPVIFFSLYFARRTESRA